MSAVDERQNQIKEHRAPSFGDAWVCKTNLSRKQFDEVLSDMVTELAR